jgi:hypothetical protein
MDLTVILTGIGFMTIISIVCGLALMVSTVIIDKCEIIGKFFLLLAYMSFMVSLPVSLAASLIFSFFNRRLARAMEKEHRNEIAKWKE